MSYQTAPFSFTHRHPSLEQLDFNNAVLVNSLPSILINESSELQILKKKHPEHKELIEAEIAKDKLIMTAVLSKHKEAATGHRSAHPLEGPTPQFMLDPAKILKKNMEDRYRRLIEEQFPKMDPETKEQVLAEYPISITRGLSLRAPSEDRADPSATTDQKESPRST